ncbi:MAG: antitoxin HicB [Parcubacteria group bacterium RIFCSPHIGHO2_01_FULL_56_18]|nr:MAG: antitoxin HicB [Parcubacteria group bacterium RIFCSPHIGHO2_01_FULL_56_18]
MLSTFLRQKLARAKYKLLADGTYFGEVSGVAGVWANARTLEVCRDELREVLEEWVLLKVRNRKDIPGLKISFDRRRAASHA